LTIKTGIQNQNMADAPLIADLARNIGSISVGNVTTYGAQTYSSDSVTNLGVLRQINAQNNPPGNASSQVFSEGIATGTRMAFTAAGKDAEAHQSRLKAAPGSVSVTSPESECKASEEDCLNAKPI